MYAVIERVEGDKKVCFTIASNWLTEENTLLSYPMTLGSHLKTLKF